MFNQVKTYVVGGLAAIVATTTVLYTTVSDKLKGPDPGSEQWMAHKEELYKNYRSDILDLKYQLTQTVDFNTINVLKTTLTSVRASCVDTAVAYNKFVPESPTGKRLNAEDCQR